MPLTQIVGIGVAGVGGYLANSLGHFNIVSYLLLGVGGTIVLLAGLMLCCGTKSRCFMLFYNLILSFLLAGQLLLAVCSLIQSTRTSMLNTIAKGVSAAAPLLRAPAAPSRAPGPQAQIQNVTSYVEDPSHQQTIEYGGFGMLGVFCVQLLAVLFNMCQVRRAPAAAPSHRPHTRAPQRKRLANLEYASDSEDEERGKARLLSGADRQVSLSKGVSRREAEESQARSRYREKYRQYYERYGVDNK